MNVSYDYYKIFYYVGRYGNFTKAAKMLGNSQPNITRAMNNLEAQLGLTLFIRSKRGIRLTYEGEKLYEKVSLAVEQLILAEKQIEEAKGLEMGTVTIGVSEIALHELLLPALSVFRKQYPGIAIKISNESTPSAIQSLKDGLVDFCLVTTPLPEEGFCHYEALRPFMEYPLISKRFGEYKGLLGVDEDESKPRSLNFEEYKGLFGLDEDKRKSQSLTIPLKRLEDYPLIMLSEGTGTRQYYDELFRRFGVEMNPHMIAATVDQVMPMVKAGLGIGFVPGSMIGNEDDVVRLDIKEKLPPRKICLAYDKTRPFGACASRLIDNIRELAEVKV